MQIHKQKVIASGLYLNVLMKVADDMKVVILAGGFGTRISEESYLKPKPMVEIGGMPILWHIMKIYSFYGFNEFVICCGYKSHVIKEYFANYYLHKSDVTFDFCEDNKMTIHSNISEPWKITLVDTGLSTMTGGRIRRVQKYIGNEPFMMTYGDGVSNINILELLEFHKSYDRIATISAVNAGQKFGVLDINNDNLITSFREKSIEDSSRINGGFMVLSPRIFEMIDNDATVFENNTLDKVAKCGQLTAYRHHGFWHCMDTQRDKVILDEMWENGNAPWKVWE